MENAEVRCLEALGDGELVTGQVFGGWEAGVEGRRLKKEQPVMKIWAGIGG